MTRLTLSRAALRLHGRGIVTMDIDMMRVVKSIVSARARVSPAEIGSAGKPQYEFHGALQ